jgi:hypothetical protein
MQGAGGGTDQAGNTVVGNGIMTPIVQLTANGTAAIGNQDLLLAYNIDVYNDIRYYKSERFPLLTAMMANAKPADLSRYVVSETDEDKEYFDNLFTTLRQRQVARSTTAWNARSGYLQASGGTTLKQPLANTNSAFVGGKLAFTAVAASGTELSDFISQAYVARAGGADVPATTANVAMLGTPGALVHAPVSLTKYTGKKVCAFGFSGTGLNLQGNVASVVEHHVANLAGIGYVATKTITESGTASDVWSGLEYIPGSSAKCYMLFDNLGISITNDLSTDTIENIQKHAIKVGVHQFWYNALWSKFIIVLDVEDANMDVTWNTATGTNDGNYLLMTESANGATLASLEATGYTYIYPCFQVGAAFGVSPQGIPEGSSKQGGNTFKRTFRSKVNYTQIFRADSWSITGTKMAERKARFVDDWMDTRETNLFLYKNKITQAMLFGQADEFDGYNTSTGKYERIRTTSGVWDRNQNDFKVVRMSLSDFSTSFSSMTASDNLRRFINEVGQSVTAFTGMKTKPTVSVACSMEMIVALGELESAGKSNGPNLFGQLALGTLPEGMKKLGVPSLSYETPRVKLIFMWDPALDYESNFPLPYYLTSSGVSPRKIMMALDVKSFNVRTLRPDRLQAGIQNPGDDKYEEDILGEHGAEVLNSRKNTIFIIED